MSPHDAYIVQLVSTLCAVICVALVLGQLMFLEVANIIELGRTQVTIVGPALMFNKLVSPQVPMGH